MALTGTINYNNNRDRHVKWDDAAFICTSNSIIYAVGSRTVLTVMSAYHPMF